MEKGAITDIGRSRKLNEDSLWACDILAESHKGLASCGLFIVADGMGGHNAGEFASDLAVRSFVTNCLAAILGRPNATMNEKLNIVEESAIKANAIVFAAGREKDLHGMGTTLTAALITGNDLFVSHIGDSRCYVINARETLQVTRDHSFVQDLVDSNVITSDEARVHPRRNEITRVLGYQQNVEPDIQRIKLYEGDSVLLCSDGLCGVLTSARIAEVVNSSPGAQAACEELVAEANLMGGPDNITVIIATPSGLPSMLALTASTTMVKPAQSA